MIVRKPTMEGVNQHKSSGRGGVDDNNNSEFCGMAEKYGLRPRTIIKRLQQEKTRQEIPKKPSRAKSRPAPLSKYRRKTANARERHRMREINNAFESLRKVLPEALEVQASASMTKIMTLRLAVSYIRTLSSVLQDDAEADLGSYELQHSLQHSLHSSLQRAMEDSERQYSSCGAFSQHYIPQMHQVDLTKPQGSSAGARSSLGSSSDLEELLSDDSGLLEDNLDVFHDIQPLPEGDAFDLLLGAEKGIAFTTHLCS